VPILWNEWYFQKNDLSKFLNFFNKLSTLFGLSLSKEFWNYNNYLFGIRFTKRNKIMTIGDPRKNILSLIKLIFFLRTSLNWGGKALFVDVDLSTTDLIKKRNDRFCQYFIKRPLNISGGLTNFNNTRWYYLKNTLYFFPKFKPSFLVLLNHTPAYNAIINEACQLSIPVIGSINFNTNFLEKKIAYNIYIPLNNLSRLDFRLFFLEIFKYTLKLFNSLSYILKPGLLIKAGYKNLLRYFKRTLNITDIFKQRRKIKVLSIITKKEKRDKKKKTKKKFRTNKKKFFKLPIGRRLRRKFFLSLTNLRLVNYLNNLIEIVG